MIYAIFAVLVLIADQWLKYWVTVNITPDTGVQPLINGVVELVNTQNKGMALGLLDDVPFARWILIGLAVVLCIVVIILIAKRTFPGKFPTWCMVMFMAGALGNCIDRSIYGQVTDMFRLEFVSFAVFNVADIVLTVSCFLFIIYLFVGGKNEEEEAAAIAAAAAGKAEKKRSARRVSDRSELSENEGEVEIWDSFKAGLHNVSDEETVVAVEKLPSEEVAPVPEVTDAPTIKKDAADEDKYRELAELIPELGDLDLGDIASADTANADISVEDILREFGS